MSLDKLWKETKMRTAVKERTTKETSVKIELNLDGNGDYEINTEFKFFKHMLEQFAAHSGYDVKITAKSLDGDSHHLVEDTAITLGETIIEALKDKKGIKRYGTQFLPMDEALVRCVLDLSGRVFCKVNVPIKDERTSDFETVLLAHFFRSFAQSSKSTIHIDMLDGEDTHHIIEAVFKSFARALSQATSIDEKNADKIMSTKGIL